MGKRGRYSRRSSPSRRRSTLAIPPPRLVHSTAINIALEAILQPNRGTSSKARIQYVWEPVFIPGGVHSRLQVKSRSDSISRSALPPPGFPRVASAGRLEPLQTRGFAVPGLLIGPRRVSFSCRNLPHLYVVAVCRAGGLETLFPHSAGGTFSTTKSSASSGQRVVRMRKRWRAGHSGLYSPVAGQATFAADRATRNRMVHAKRALSTSRERRDNPSESV
jgi:hypothetical protein